MSARQWGPLAAGLIGLLSVVGCDSPTIPPGLAPYDFHLQTVTPGGGAAALTFHWPLGSTVAVFVSESGGAGRPSLISALDTGIARWNAAATLGEVTLSRTDDLDGAGAVLEWSDGDPVLATPPACVGPVSGAASTRGCLSADGTALEPWPRRDGAESRVVFVVRLLPQPGLAEDAAARFVTHELGHVLGILSHSPNPEDLMWGGVLSAQTPSRRDQVTLRSLYQTPTDLRSP